MNNERGECCKKSNEQKYSGGSSDVQCGENASNDTEEKSADVLEKTTSIDSSEIVSVGFFILRNPIRSSVDDLEIEIGFDDQASSRSRSSTTPFVYRPELMLVDGRSEEVRSREDGFERSFGRREGGRSRTGEIRGRSHGFV